MNNYNLSNPDEKRVFFQYKAIFGANISCTLLKNIRLSELVIEYGVLGYDEGQAIHLGYNHLKLQSYNKLMTDDVIFSLNKLK